MNQLFRKNNYDLSINKYRVVERERIEYEPVQNILNRIESTESDFLNGFRELSNMIEEEK